MQYNRHHSVTTMIPEITTTLINLSIHQRNESLTCQDCFIQELYSGGTRYVFLSPLKLVCYLAVVLPLRTGPQLSKILQSASTGPLFRYRYFYRKVLPLVRNSANPLLLFSLQSTATSLQFRYSATAIFTVVHCTVCCRSLFRSRYSSLQFAIPPFAVLQFSILQFAIPLFAILQFTIPQFANPQFAIPQFAIPQYQYQYRYQPPLFDNFFSLNYLYI